MEMKGSRQRNKNLVLWKDKQDWQTLNQTNQKRDLTKQNHNHLKRYTIVIWLSSMSVQDWGKGIFFNLWENYF
jgi:hypothetical protein